MYRKYIQDLADDHDPPAAPPGPPPLETPSPDPAKVFPDTHLIVGGAHLKAARAGAAHRDQAQDASSLTTPGTSASSGVSSGRSASLLQGPSPEAASSAEARGGRRRPAASEVIQLVEFVSRNNTPEFRRRPRVTGSPGAPHAPPASSPRPPPPMRVWDAHGCQEAGKNEIIVARPVVEAASRSRAHGGPSPARRDRHGARVVVEAAHPTIYAQEVIKVMPIRKKSHPDVGGGAREAGERAGERGSGQRPSQRFSGRHLQGEVVPWARPSSGARFPSKVHAGGGRQALSQPFPAPLSGLSDQLNWWLS